MASSSWRHVFFSFTFSRIQLFFCALYFFLYDSKLDSSPDSPAVYSIRSLLCFSYTNRHLPFYVHVQVTQYLVDRIYLSIAFTLKLFPCLTPLFCIMFSPWLKQVHYYQVSYFFFFLFFCYCSCTNIGDTSLFDAMVQVHVFLVFLRALLYKNKYSIILTTLQT